MPNSTYARSQGRNHFGRRRHSKYITKGYLKAIIGVPETKWINTSVVPTAVPSVLSPTTPLPQSILNAVPVGTTQSTRIGSEITNKSLHIRLLLQRAAVDAVVRVIIFWSLDGEAAGTAATPQRLLEDSTSYLSPLNKDYGKSFWVRFDKTYTLAAGQTALQVDEIWRKLKCKTEYDSETNVATCNSLFIVAISNQTVVANQPLISYTARLTYMDV